MYGEKVANARPDELNYATCKWPIENDVIVSVISIHHQETDRDKKKLFKKIYRHLAAGGIFIFGDLVTFEDKNTAAFNEALHFHHLVENASSRKNLTEWAFHHKYLNCLAPVEKQLQWLQQTGFEKVRLIYHRYNTVLI